MQIWVNFLITITFLLGFAQAALGAGEVSQVFTLDGRLYTDNTSKTPLSDSNVTLKFQILDAGQSCIIYEEVIAGVDTTVSGGGYFSVEIGSAVGAAKRLGSVTGYFPNANSMATVFSNNAPGGIPGKNARKSSQVPSP